MADVVSIKVYGLRDVGRAMRKLSNKVSTKLCYSATLAGAKPIKKQAIANIIRSPSVRTGSLRDGVIIKRIPKSQNTVTAMHAVTVRGRGKKTPSTKTKQTIAPYASKVEFGTVKMQAEPFLLPAFDAKKSEAVWNIRASLERGVDRETKKKL